MNTHVNLTALAVLFIAMLAFTAFRPLSIVPAAQAADCTPEELTRTF